MIPPSGAYSLQGPGTARVSARAPGHDFEASAAIAGGPVTVDDGRVGPIEFAVDLRDARPRDALALGRMGAYLNAHPPARIIATAPFADLRPAANGGWSVEADLCFKRGAHQCCQRVSLCAQPQPDDTFVIEGGFELGFSALGYPPPKLLFLRVQDRVRISVSMVVAVTA